MLLNIHFIIIYNSFKIIEHWNSDYKTKKKTYSKLNKLQIIYIIYFLVK